MCHRWQVSSEHSRMTRSRWKLSHNTPRSSPTLPRVAWPCCIRRLVWYVPGTALAVQRYFLCRNVGINERYRDVKWKLVNSPCRSNASCTYQAHDKTKVATVDDMSLPRSWQMSSRLFYTRGPDLFQLDVWRDVLHKDTAPHPGSVDTLDWCSWTTTKTQTTCRVQIKFQDRLEHTTPALFPTFTQSTTTGHVNIQVF